MIRVNEYCTKGIVSRIVEMGLKWGVLCDLKIHALFGRHKSLLFKQGVRKAL